MTTINQHYTINYSQPSEYRFSHDSVFLARHVFESILDNKVLSYNRTLDLCSGCGIVGIDLIFHLLQADLNPPKHIDFVDVQDIYRTHIQANISSLENHFKIDLAHNFLNLNYNQIAKADSILKEKYDLIIANPPYFRPNQGTLSKSEFKNRCRFFIDSDLENLILAISNGLKSGGQAYVLLKSLENHNIKIEDEFSKLPTDLTLKKLQKIRQTDLYLLTKN